MQFHNVFWLKTKNTRTKTLALQLSQLRAIPQNYDPPLSIYWLVRPKGPRDPFHKRRQASNKVQLTTAPNSPSYFLYNGSSVYPVLMESFSWSFTSVISIVLVWRLAWNPTPNILPFDQRPYSQPCRWESLTDELRTFIASMATLESLIGVRLVPDHRDITGKRRYSKHLS